MTELEKNAEELAYKWWHSVDKEFVDVIDAYVQGYKNAVDKACDWLENIFHDRSHHSGRGDAGEIVTYDFDSMQEFILKFRKAMEGQQ